MFCCTLLYVHSSIAIILMGKRELVALLNLSSWCLVMVERLFLAVPRGCLRFVIVVFPEHTHLLFLNGGYLSEWLCFFLSCISLFRIVFTHHNHDTYWKSIYNTAQQKFWTNIGQGHNPCKPKHLSLEEAKTVYSQKRPQSGATEGTLYRLYLSLPRQRPNPHAQKYNLFKLERNLFSDFQCTCVHISRQCARNFIAQL